MRERPGGHPGPRQSRRHAGSPSEGAGQCDTREIGDQMLCAVVNADSGPRTPWLTECKRGLPIDRGVRDGPTQQRAATQKRGYTEPRAAVRTHGIRAAGEVGEEAADA